MKRRKPPAPAGHSESPTAAVDRLPTGDQQRPATPTPPDQTLAGRVSQRWRNTWIGAIAILFAGAIPVLLNLTKLADWTLKRLGRPALAVTPLVPGKTLLPLDGHPVKVDPSNGTKVFCGGVALHLVVAHNGRGDHSIAINDIRVIIDAFEPAQRPELTYNTLLVPPTGQVRPHQFIVNLQGNVAKPATWISGNGPDGTIQARSANMLDTPEPITYTLKNSPEDLEVFDGKLIPLTPGLYRLRVQFSYTSGVESNEYLSDPFIIYSEAD